jgi:hypothetical protein
MTAPALKNLTPDEQRLYWLLYEDLLAGAQLGGQAALLELAQSGALKGAVDWAQANTGAATWAQNYLYDLVQQINQTTQAQLQTAVSAFQATPGMTRADLERLILEGPGGVQDLVSKTGRIIPAAERAEMISSTEVTRSYTEGALEFTRASGLDMVEPEADKIPPLHVRCRCSLSAFTRDDGVTSWHFRTDNDDLVCEICGPLQNQDVGLPSPAAAVEPEAVKPVAGRGPISFYEPDSTPPKGIRIASGDEQTAFLKALDQMPNEVQGLWKGGDLTLAILENGRGAYQQGSWVFLEASDLKAYPGIAQHEFLHRVVRVQWEDKLGAYHSPELFTHAALNADRLGQLNEDLTMMLSLYQKDRAAWALEVSRDFVGKSYQAMSLDMANKKIDAVLSFLQYVGAQL